MTALLRQWGAGNRSALDRLMPVVYGELRRLAGRYLRQERQNTQVNRTWGPGAYPTTPLPTFGQLTEAAAPRQMQLGVKLNF